MRFAFSSATAVYAVLLAVAARLLPERVPLHFGLSGEPDRWGSRTEALLVLGGSGLVLAICCGLGARLVSRADLTWRWWNLPHRDWWTATAQRQAVARARLRTDLLGTGTALLVLLSVLLLGVVRAARSGDGSLGPVTGVVVGLLVLGVLARALWATLIRYRPEEGR